jgi:hypothetical protein
VCATTPAFSSWRVVRGCPSPPSSLRAPTLFATCLFCCYWVLFNSFSFFPEWGLVCPGSYADLAQGCLWEYCVLLSSPWGLLLTKPSGHCLLAVAQEPSWFLHLTWHQDQNVLLSKVLQEIAQNCWCIISILYISSV